MNYKPPALPGVFDRRANLTGFGSGPAGMGLSGNGVDRSLAVSVLAGWASASRLTAKRRFGAGSAGFLVETTALLVSPTLAPVAAGKRGLKRGLRTHEHTVIVRLDETTITEIPPLYSCYGRRGEQVQVPIIETHAKRVIHGAFKHPDGSGRLADYRAVGSRDASSFSPPDPGLLEGMAHSAL